MNEIIINQTKKWIEQVVIGCNFCPFAAKEFTHDTIAYRVESSRDLKICLQAFLQECEKLRDNAAIATSFLIFETAFTKFRDYLDFVALVEKHLRKHGYEGVFQVASFHPDYCFANAPADDAANYTNRSIYPMLHLLREAGMEQALTNFPNPGTIPERNIAFARAKGTAYMQQLRAYCMQL